MKSDTPRTNQVLATNHYREPIEDLGFAIMVEHARQLERELNEAHRLLGNLAKPHTAVDDHNLTATEVNEIMNSKAAIWERCAAYWSDGAKRLERELDEAKALLQVYRNEIQTGKLERTRQQQILDALNNE